MEIAKQPAERLCALTQDITDLQKAKHALELDDDKLRLTIESKVKDIVALGVPRELLEVQMERVRKRLDGDGDIEMGK